MSITMIVAVLSWSLQMLSDSDADRGICQLPRNCDSIHMPDEGLRLLAWTMDVFSLFYSWRFVVFCQLRRATWQYTGYLGPACCGDKITMVATAFFSCFCAFLSV